MSRRPPLTGSAHLFWFLLFQQQLRMLLPRADLWVPGLRSGYWDGVPWPGISEEVGVGWCIGHISHACWGTFVPNLSSLWLNHLTEIYLPASWSPWILWGKHKTNPQDWGRRGQPSVTQREEWQAAVQDSCGLRCILGLQPNSRCCQKPSRRRLWVLPIESNQGTTIAPHPWDLP